MRVEKIRLYNVFFAKSIDKVPPIVYNVVIIQGRGAILKNRRYSAARRRRREGGSPKRASSPQAERVGVSEKIRRTVTELLWSAIGSIRIHDGIVWSRGVALAAPVFLSKTLYARLKNYEKKGNST